MRRAVLLQYVLSLFLFLSLPYSNARTVSVFTIGFTLLRTNLCAIHRALQMLHADDGSGGADPFFLSMAHVYQDNVATLLADVLSWFWRMGGIIVGSSNKVPDDLYKNGVQRERLEPFVEALKARCPVILMRSERDWRVVRGSGGKRSWYDFAHRREFEATLEEIKRGAPANSDGTSRSPVLRIGCHCDEHQVT